MMNQRNNSFNKESIRRQIEPYAIESAVQVILDVAVMALAVAVMSYAGFPLGARIAVVAVYFVIALLLHYRVFILTVIDRAKGDYITETFQIGGFSTEYSFAGNRLGRSYVHFFYPRNMEVDRYTITVLDSNGKEKKIRSVMSAYRRSKYSELSLQQINCLKVTYLKRSRILISVDQAIETKPIEKKKERETIEKAIRCINRSI